MGHDYDWEEREEHSRVMSRVLGAQLQRALRRRKKELEFTESLLTGQLKLVDSPPKTKRISVGAALPPLTPTAEEWDRVTAAYENGLKEAQSLRAQAKYVKIATRDIRRFLKVWNRMSPVAQGCLVGDDELADVYEGKIVRYRIEDRAAQALWYLTVKQGRPRAIANLRAAEVLTGLWKARGGKTKPGRLYADKKSGPTFGSDLSPNDFVKFIASALRRLDPTLKTDGIAARCAKSAVDALHNTGQL